MKLVIHHVDGVWQLVCGERDHPEDCSDFEPICLGHLTRRQPNLSNASGLEPGNLAEVGDFGVWITRPLAEDG